MLTSKQRAQLRAQANGLDTILMVGKSGVTEQVIAEANQVLDARELVKGRVLETALMSSREASDAICAATGAEGISCVGSKFVIYRRSPKLEARRQAEALKAKAARKVNPVRAGVQARRKAARKARDERNEYFRQAAIEAARARKK